MKTPNEYRLKMGAFATDESYGVNGVYQIPFESYTLTVVASDGFGWEHVSVSLKNRTPNWKEMCFIKDLFWNEEEMVVQFHPPRSEYVNNHENCLHLWRPKDNHIKLPDSRLVGVKQSNL